VDARALTLCRKGVARQLYIRTHVPYYYLLLQEHNLSLPRLQTWRISLGYTSLLLPLMSPAYVPRIR
jgi:hypothetical protein